MYEEMKARLETFRKEVRKKEKSDGRIRHITADTSEDGRILNMLKSLLNINH